MTVKDVYEIVSKIDAKLDNVINNKADKDACKEKHSVTNKTIWSLFGVNVFGIVIIIITIFLK